MARRQKSMGEKWDHLRDVLEFQLPVPKGEGEAVENIRARNRRRAFAARTVYVLALVALCALLARSLVSRHAYSGYEMISVRNVADNGSNYRYFNGRLLRYSQDGLSLLDTDLAALWSQAYDITQPVAAVSGNVAAIYDRRGTRVRVFNEEGEIGAFGTELPILAARVSGAGNVVAALENGDYTKLVYYTPNGEVIAELAEDAGREEQVAAFAVSEDGKTIAVAYFGNYDTASGTRLVFYDFSAAGQELEDHVAFAEEEKYKNNLVPYIQAIPGGFLVVRDNGFSIYPGNGSQGESVDVAFNGKILSVVQGDDCIGFVFDGENEEHRYRMEIYGYDGRRRADFPVDIAYDRVSITEGGVVFTNGTEMAVYTLDGFCTYHGKLEEGTIFDVIRIGPNRYFLVTDMRAGLFRLK